jgi:hypothetical protein
MKIILDFIFIYGNAHCELERERHVWYMMCTEIWWDFHPIKYLASTKIICPLKMYEYGVVWDI